MEERVLTTRELKEDSFEKTIRPDSIDEYIGQKEVKENLDIFIKEQEILNELLDKSLIPVLHLEVTHYSIDQLADNVAEYLEKSGGLFCKG